MIEIKEIDYRDVVKYEEELKRFLYMNIYENYPETDVENMVNLFYSNMCKYAEDGSAVLLGAFDGEAMVGFHWGHETIFLGKRRMHSYINGIDKAYRGQHIGSDFFRKLEEISRDRGIHEIEAFCKEANQVAVNYHLHNGFKIESYRVVKKI